MKKYELFLVLPGTLDENEVSGKTGEIVAMIQELGHNVEIKPLGKNRLAYPIKQVRYGYFYTVHFEADTDKVKMIEEKLRLSRGLLRAIVYLYNNKLEGAEKISYFSQTSNLVEPEENEGKVVEEAVEQVVVAKEEETVEDEIEDKTEDREVLPEEEIIEEKKIKKSAVYTKTKKIDLDEIDKKLDKILSDEDINI